MVHGLIIGNTKHGRGVFATKTFLAGEIIESCPVLKIPSYEVHHIDRTILFDYYFEWADSIVIALGYGSLYNHSYNANAYATKDHSTNTLTITAVNMIYAGDEIVINYLGEPTARGSLWFDVD